MSEFNAIKNISILNKDLRNGKYSINENDSLNARLRRESSNGKVNNRKERKFNLLVNNILKGSIYNDLDGINNINDLITSMTNEKYEISKTS